MYIKRRCKLLLEVGFMHILTVFGYWNPMGFIPEFCIIKALCSVGIQRVRDEKAIGYMEMDAKSKKKKRCILLNQLSNTRNLR